MSADEAAKLIYPNATIGMSGFTPGGSCQTVPLAIARRAEATGEKLNLTVMTGASVGDGSTAPCAQRRNERRTPYQTIPPSATPSTRERSIISMYI